MKPVSTTVEGLISEIMEEKGWTREQATNPVMLLSLISVLKEENNMLKGF